MAKLLSCSTISREHKSGAGMAYREHKLLPHKNGESIIQVTKWVSHTKNLLKNNNNNNNNTPSRPKTSLSSQALQSSLSSPLHRPPLPLLNPASHSLSLTKTLHLFPRLSPSFSMFFLPHSFHTLRERLSLSRTVDTRRRSSAVDHSSSVMEAACGVVPVMVGGRWMLSSTTQGLEWALGVGSRPSKSEALRPRGMRRGMRRERLGVEKVSRSWFWSLYSGGGGG